VIAQRAGLFFSMARTDETPRERNGPVMHKLNMLLASDVQEELDWDPQIDDARIVVRAESRSPDPYGANTRPSEPRTTLWSWVGSRA
jgi:hypothetical protein